VREIRPRSAKRQLTDGHLISFPVR
jgi:hypothetical protein